MHGLEGSLGDTATVLRMDLFSADGSAFFHARNLGSVPAIVVLDPAGTAHYQSTGRLPDAAAIRQAVEALNRR